MYDTHSAQFKYWNAEAEKALSFERVCWSVSLDMWRRGLSGSLFAHLDEISRAEAVFAAQYHRALAYRELAAHHMSPADIDQ